VAARWRDDEVVKRLDAKATEIVDKLKSGTTLADIAAADGLKVETAQGLKRRENEPLPAKLVAEVFRTGKGEVGRGDGKQPTDRVVFRVTDVTVPPLTAGSPEAKQLADMLRGAFSEEILTQYVGRLQSEMGASVNQAALGAATGGRPIDQQ
jgi:peptidyl-prolyl cis-trans isomerase D